MVHRLSSLGLGAALLGTAFIASGCSAPAPEFSHGTFETLQVPSALFSTESLAGKPMLIDFWATWCLPCRETMPVIDQIYQKYNEKGLIVMGISGENRADLMKFAASTRYRYPLYRDVDGMYQAKHQVSSLPTLWLVDKTGKIIYAHVGDSIDVPSLEKAIEKALQ